MVRLNLLDYVMFFLFITLITSLDLENVTTMQSFGLLAGFGWLVFVIVRIVKQTKETAAAGKQAAATTTRRKARKR